MIAADSRFQQNSERELAAVLQREINQLQNLMHALEQEYAALSEQQTETLEQVVSKKHENIRALEHLGEQREALLASMKTITQEQLSKAVGGDSDFWLAGLWNELVLLAAKCQDMNRVNGSIVELVSRQSRHALDILRGISPDPEARPELYDQSGYKTLSPQSHSLTKA